MLDNIISLLKEKLKKIDSDNIGILYDFATFQSIIDFKCKYTLIDEFLYPQNEHGEQFSLRMDIFNILERKLSVVLGDFSGGKTYTAKQIYKLLANGFIKPERQYGYYPLLVDFISLAKEYQKCKDIFKSIALAIDYPLETLTEIVQTYDTVFIFDSLDDVISSVQDTLVNEILSDPFVLNNKCIFTAYVNGVYCECGRLINLELENITMAKFKIEALRDKDIEMFIDSFSSTRMDGLFDAIKEIESKMPDYKSLSRNVDSLMGIISYYEKNSNLPQNRLELTEYFIDNFLLNRLNISIDKLSTIKEYLGYKVTKRIYSLLNDSLSNDKPKENGELYGRTDNSKIESLLNKKIVSILNTNINQAYLSAYYIYKRLEADDYSVIKKIADTSYSIIQLVLEFLLLKLDKQKDCEERVIRVLDLLQDTFKPNYDSIVKSVLFFNNYKEQALDNILKTMLTRGYACIITPPETTIEVFSCIKDKVNVGDKESYCANPYEELFYYVVKYDLYDYLSEANCKNKIEKRLIQELLALNIQEEADIVEIVDEYTDGFMYYLASEFRVGVNSNWERLHILKGHISVTTKSIEFYKKNLWVGNQFKVFIDEGIVKETFCSNNPYLTSIYLDEHEIPISRYFKGNGNLKRIKVNKNNKQYYSQNNCLIDYEEKTLILGCNSSIIPNGVMIIGVEAFLNQQELSEIVIPNSVREIDEYAFMYNTALKNLVLSENLITVNKFAFAFCTSLKELHLPAKFKFSNYAFWALESLESISIDPKNKYYRVEYGCLIENKKDMIIATTAYAQIPEGIHSISGYAFAYNENMTTLRIPKSLAAIHSNAFMKCTGLKSLTIPKNITTLGEKCFFGCSSLKKVKVYAKIRKKYHSLFAKCRALESAKLKGTVDSTADRIFFGCMNLKNIELPDNTSIIGSGFAKDCRSLRRINLPNSLRVIGSYAFDNSVLVELTVPENVGVINQGTFNNCSYLNEINYLGKLFNVDYKAFRGCRALKRFSGESTEYFKVTNDCIIETNEPVVYLAFPQSIIPSNINIISSYAYESRMNLQEIVLDSNIQYIENDAFANCYNLKKVTMRSVVKLVHSCFSCCVGLEEIDLGDSLEEIGFSVFKNCKSLKTLTIPKKVESISQGCIYGCDSLEEINFFAQIRTIRSRFFSGLKALKRVNFTDTIKKWDNKIFKDCTALEEYTIPDSVTNIGRACFEGCTSLKEVTLSANMESIPPKTFDGCVSLKRLTIPASIVEICKAFENCTSLDEIIYLGTKKQWEYINLDGSCNDIFGELPTNVVKCIDGNTLLK